MTNSRHEDPSSPSGLATFIGYITGPRAIQPAGVRVMEPPPNTRQFQRGNLYAVVELFGEHPDRAAIGEQLLSELQQTYYAAKGSQSQVIVDALQSAQDIVREVNTHAAGYPLQAGLLCAALLNKKLVVVSTGPAFALVHSAGRVQMFPADPITGSGGFGNSPIEMFRADVEEGDALFLGGGSWLQQVHDRTLAGIVAYTTAENCSAAADELYARAGDTLIPGLLIALAEGQNPPRRGPSAPGSPPTGPSGGTPPRQPPPTRRPRFGILPTALATPPPVQMPPTESELLAARAAEDRRPTQAAREEPFSDSSRHRDSFQETTLHQDTDAARPGSDKVGQEAQSILPPAERPTDHEVATPRLAEEAGMADAGRLASTDESMEAGYTSQPSTPQSEASTRAVIAALEATAQAQAAKRAAARAAEIAAPRLPQEPGDEIDPIFPPPADDADAAERDEPKRPLLAHAAVGWQATRAWFASMLPERMPPAQPERNIALEDSAETYELVWPEPKSRGIGRESAATREPPDRQPDPATELEPVDAPEPSQPPAMPTPRLEPPAIGIPQRTQGSRARLFLAVSLLILILVPAIVAAISLGTGNSNREEAEKLTANAEIVLMGAQTALDQGDRALARELLTDAREVLARAIELDGTNDIRADLGGQIMSELQEVLQVTPFYGLTAPILTFPAEARPRKVVIVNEDIFVLDSGRQSIVQYRFDPATRTADDQPGQVILRQGDVVDGVIMGTPADMVYVPLTPGVVDRPSLFILDRNNNVFRFDPRVAGVALVDLGDRSAWGSITHIQTFNGLLYFVDEGRSQIWRVNLAQTDTPATGWFAAQTQVNLAGLMSIEIDGDIWLLFSNGMILRYRTGEQLPFSPENSIALADEPSDMVVTWRETANIYLVDAAQQRVLVYDKSGAYLRQLRAPEEPLLRGLVAVAIDEVSGVMFLLTQTGLFTHPLVQ